MQKQCINCQNVFIKKVNCASKAWRKSKYCSIDCRKKGETLNLVLRNKRNPSVESGTMRFNGVSYTKEWCLENPKEVNKFREARRLVQKNIRKDKNKKIIEERRLLNPRVLKTDEEKRLWQVEYRKTHKLENRNRSQTDNSKFRQYQGSAKIRGLEFSLTKEQFVEIFHKKCSYCGDEARGIDRINNLIGYTFENSTSCCKICNKMKIHYSKDFFITHCKKIVKSNP